MIGSTIQFLELSTNVCAKSGQKYFAKQVIEVPEDILKWKVYNSNEMSFLHEECGVPFFRELDWYLLKKLYLDPNAEVVGSVNKGHVSVFGYNNMENDKRMMDQFVGLLPVSVSRMFEKFLPLMKWTKYGTVTDISDDIIKRKLPNYCTVLDDPYQMDSDTDELFPMLELNDITCPLDWLDWTSVSSGVFLESDGYRGMQLYNGAVKIGDAWFWIDLCSGDITMIENWDNPEVQSVLYKKGIEVLMFTYYKGEQLGHVVKMNFQDSKLTKDVVDACIEQYCNEMDSEEDVQNNIELLKRTPCKINGSGFTIDLKDVTVLIGVVVYK